MFDDEYTVTLRHSHILHSAMNLACSRFEFLEQSKQDLNIESLTDENMLKLQVETAKNIGGIETRSLLFASEEIGKYYFGPVQIALSLLWAAIEKYDVLSKGNRLLQDMAIEEYCQSNREFIVSLKALRDSIIHPRSDNVQAIKEFSRAYGARHVALLIEGELAYRNYLIRSQDMLRTTKLRSMRVRPSTKSSQTVREFELRPHGYFRTMCINLAMASSFSRDSFMSKTDAELGFLEVGARSHAYIHNQSALHIVAALLYQAIENYLAIQNLKPNFIDLQLETFLDNQSDRGAYIDGMRLIRNSTFHVPNFELKSRQQENVKIFASAFDLDQANEIRSLLYGFTEKVFSGEIDIWEDMWARTGQAKPDFKGLLDAVSRGEMDIHQVLERLMSDDPA